MQINNTSNSPKFAIKNQPTFGSSISEICQNAASGIGKSISKGGIITSVAEKVEAHGHILSPASMVALLYGATIIPRYIQAYDKHDRREILLRDTLSITALLYFAESLKRGFSRACEKTSGFVLNLKPADKYSNPLSKAWGYLNPLKGLNVMNTEQLQSKYSNIEGYKGGFEGFAEFIKAQGGKLNEVLHFDEKIRGLSKDIIGTDVIKSSHEEIVNGFKAPKNTKALADFFEALRKNDNVLVTKARKMNSYFGFASTFILVPAFMVWIQHFNEKLTKKIVAKDLAKKQANEVAQGGASKGHSSDKITFEKVVKTAEHSPSNEAKKAYSSFLSEK